jgi:hypothetical protein
LAAALGGAPPALADGGRRRLAIVSDDSGLVHAVGLALDPWDVDVVPVPPLRGLDEGLDAGAWARGVAAAAQVELVVWLSGTNPVALGWYDVATRVVHSRELGVILPLDESEAAAVALTLKAELRPDLVVVRPEHPAGVPVAPRRAMADVPAVRPKASGAESSWDVVGGGGARWMGGSNVDGRASLGVHAWPRFGAMHWGAGVDVSLGVGVPIDDAAFRGRWMDAEIAPMLRFRWRFGRRVAAETALGASMHVTWIDGTALVDGTSRSAERVDGSIDGSASLAYAVTSRVALGLAFGAAVWLRTQGFAVRGETVLALTPVPLDGQALVRVGLDTP